MATTVPVYSQPRFRLSRFLAFVVIALGLVCLGLGAWFYSLANSALPQLDGTIKIVGLTAPVTVSRDAHGSPTIDAKNFDDLFLAQGYVTAQDRLFQMDGMRRYAAGELAEVVGEGQVAHDRQQRILGLRLAAQKTLQASSPEVRAHMEAYARGVNAFIESHRDRLPLEFRILRYSPKPWTSEDSALIGAYMVEDLTTTPRHALVREMILAKLGPELTADLYVNSSWRDRPPTVDRPQLDQKNNSEEDDDEESEPDNSVALLWTAGVPVFPPGRMFSDNPPLVLGSNNWVVSGAHTVSGKPLLSNDMHLGHQMPNLWF